MRDLAKFKKPKATRILGGALGLLLVLSLILMPTPVLAVPQMPHQFYGTVTIGTELALGGTIVSAQIGGKEYASTTVDAEGRYGYSPDYGGTGIFKVPADDPGTPEKEGGIAGETVEFYITNEALGLDEVRADKTAEFEIWGVTELNLTVPAITATAGFGGSISPSGDVVVNYGGSQAFTITANTGYHIANVLVDGSSVGAVTSYTFTNVTANHTISASFAINTYTITATAGANGSISPSGAVVVNYGGSRAFTITANTGYHIADVLVDGSSVGAVTSYTFTNVTANHTIHASFALIPPVTYTLTVNIVGNGRVTKNPDRATYVPDTVVELTATPAAGWSFSAWSGDLTGSTNPDSITMDGDKTVTATFTQITHALTMTKVGNGTVTPGTGTYPEGDMEITATAEDGWQFSGWSAADMAEIADPSLATTTLTLDKGKTVIAFFTESGVTVEDSKTETTDPGDQTVDATTEADTAVDKSGAGTPTITVAKYSDNPGTGFSGDTGKYIDVHVDDTTDVDEIEIKVYYTNAEIRGLVESSLRLRWWNDTEWVVCSDSGVITTDIAGPPAYSGYMWAKVRSDTTPTLDDLTGAVFGGGGTAPPAAGGGGGGGAPPLPAGTTDVRGMVSTAGVFYMSATAYSEDRICWLAIPARTVGLTEELEPLTIITMLIMDEPPTPPEYAHVIGLFYDFQPSGATFEPPITLTFTYDPDNIPEGIAEEDLVLAYYDQKAGEWLNLEGTVDTGRNTITVLISHFTAVAILGYEVPEPAAFTPGSLVISPTKVDINQTVNVSLSIANTGGMAGSYEVTLKIDGEVEATQQVTVGAGASEKVTFTTSRDVAGSYSVDVNGLSGSFTVKEKPVPAPPPPPPPPAPPEVKAPINWPVVGGIAGVVIVGLVIFFIIRRRRAL